MKIEEKKPVLRDISTISPYRLNAKKHGDDQVKRLAQSIKKFGWRGNPILVDKDGVIIAGHGRRLAALSLGLTKVPVVVEEDMTAEEARAFRLADNRVAMSDIDNHIFREELLDLGNVEDLLGDIFEAKELDFAVADLLTINDGVFVSDLDSVMDEQQSHTDERIEATDTKRISIAKVLGFKDIQGSDSIYVTRFIAKLEAESGTTAEQAFVNFIKKLL